MASPRRDLSAEAFLISLGAILLEVSYTRIFSFKLVYYFTYLIIGIALLGIGSGGILVAISGRLRQLAPERLVCAASLIAASAVLAGYPLIARIRLDAFDLVTAAVQGPWTRALGESVDLALVCAILFAPFLAVGIALAVIFASAPERIHRLYAADLAGAALGCAVVVPLLTWATPPGTVMLGGFSFAVAALPLSASRLRRTLPPALIVAGLLLLGALAPGRLPDAVPDRVKSLGPREGVTSQLLFSRWSPVFRVDVAPSLRPDAHFLVHDGTIGSFLERFDASDPAPAARYAGSDRAYPFRVLDGEPRVAIIGSAGGSEVRASLALGARQVVAVELNPVTVSLHRTHFADFLGHLAEDPRVEMINGEGRSFLRAGGPSFDLIWYVAPDSYASSNAATSGAFVLSESYLYTAEAIVDSFARLSPDGILAMQFGETSWERRPKRTVRYLATARDALRELGVRDFSRHALVATAPGFGPDAVATTILLKRLPFTEDEAGRFVATAGGIDGAKVAHAWTEPSNDSPVGRVARGDDAAVAAWLASQPFALDAVHDDAPFFWHFVRFRDALRGNLSGMHLEDGAGELLILVFVAVAAAFGSIVLLLPAVAIAPVWRAIPHKLAVGVYFAALGIGFMLLEVSLIQRLTLFLGYPTYSLTVTLFALLLSSGAGSLASGRLARRRNRTLAGVALALALLVGLAILFLTPVLQSLVGLALPARVACAVAIVAPLGLCLGVLMPIGLRSVAASTPHQTEIIAWSWAVNGFFSVVSSVGATILAMGFGFDAVFAIALAVYWVGIATLQATPEPKLE